MKYFKYIIFLILFLICTLLYIQLDDYDNISSSLLSDNIETKEEIKRLSSSLDDMQEHSKELQQQINILYSIIDLKEIEIELLEDTCIDKNILPESQQNTNITLENENEVTGF